MSKHDNQVYKPCISIKKPMETAYYKEPSDKITALPLDSGCEFIDPGLYVIYLEKEQIYEEMTPETFDSTFVSWRNIPRGTRAYDLMSGMMTWDELVKLSNVEGVKQ